MIFAAAVILCLLVVNVWLVLRHNAMAKELKFNHRFSLRRVQSQTELYTTGQAYSKLSDVIDDEINRV